MSDCVHLQQQRAKRFLRTRMTFGQSLMCRNWTTDSTELFIGRSQNQNQQNS